MAKKDVLQEVKDKMKAIRESRAAELELIQKKKAETIKSIEHIDAEIKSAVERIDIDAYETAKAKSASAHAALDMYNARYDQINKHELISEEESDNVIDTLLDYESQLDDAFKTAIKQPLQTLHDLLKAYMDTINDTENTIIQWESGIHPNYRNSNALFTKSGSGRADRPIPVHRIQYTGCEIAMRINTFLNQNESHLT